MSNVLSVFEKLSGTVMLDQHDVAKNFESFSAAIRKAFMMQDSKAIRNVDTSSKVFADLGSLFIPC